MAVEAAVEGWWRRRGATALVIKRLHDLQLQLQWLPTSTLTIGVIRHRSWVCQATLHRPCTTVPAAWAPQKTNIPTMSSMPIQCRYRSDASQEANE